MASWVRASLRGGSGWDVFIPLNFEGFKGLKKIDLLWILWDDGYLVGFVDLKLLRFQKRFSRPFQFLVLYQVTIITALTLGQSFNALEQLSGQGFWPFKSQKMIEPLVYPKIEKQPILHHVFWGVPKNLPPQKKVNKKSHRPCPLSPASRTHAFVLTLVHHPGRCGGHSRLLHPLTCGDVELERLCDQSWRVWVTPPPKKKKKCWFI